MTIDEFEEYAKSHNILIMTREFYENRLKADLITMLTELKNKLIDKSWNIDMYDDDLDFECCYLNDIDEVIQQKINALRAESEAEE